MRDLSYKKLYIFAKKSKHRGVKRFAHWFGLHYFCCDIHPNGNLSDDIIFEHNAFGVVINRKAIIEEGVRIQHHVLIGEIKSRAPVIRKGVEIGACAMILGKVEIGENAVIGAGAVVTKNVPAGRTVIGNPMRMI